MRKIITISFIVLYTTISYAQTLVKNNLTFSTKAYHDLIFLASDNSKSFSMEIPPAGKGQNLATSFIVRHLYDKKLYERFNTTFEHKDVDAIMGGAIFNDHLYIFYKTKIKGDNRFAIFASHYGSDMKYTGSKMLTAYKTEAEWNNCKLVSSDNHEYFAIYSASNIVTFNNNTDITYSNDLSIDNISRIQLTNAGEIYAIGEKSGNIHLIKYTKASGEIIKKIDINEGFCDITLTSSADYKVMIAIMYGKTSLTPKALLSQYEANVEATNISLLTFNAGGLDLISEKKIAFDESFMKTIGFRNQHVKWLAFEKIYAFDNETIIAFQKHYIKREKLTGGIEMEYKVKEDIGLIQVKGDVVKQNGIDTHVMTVDGVYDYKLECKIDNYQGNLFLYYYNMKVGAGTYKDELIFSKLDENLALVSPTTLTLEGGNIHINLKSALKISDNSTLYWGHYSKMKLGTATIAY